MLTKNSTHYILIFTLILTSVISTNAQLFVPNQTFQTFLEPYYETQEHFHSTVRPYNYFQTKHALDSFAQDNMIEGSFFTHNWVGKKIFNEDLFSYQTDDFELYLNGFSNYNVGIDSAGRNFTEMRGLTLNGHIKDFFAVQTTVGAVDKMLYPSYILEHLDYKNIDPTLGGARTLILGQGVGKAGPSTDGRNQLFSTAVLSYMPNKFFRFDGGYGKNFIGNGYRSLFLSDNSNNSPFLRMTTSLGKVQFTNIYAQYRHLKQTYIDGTYMKKYAAIHHLSYNITDKINIGFFESVIYSDSLGNRGFELDYLVPYTIMRPIEFAVGSRGGNAMLGIDASFQFAKGASIYGQFILDEFKTSELFNRSGWHANKFGGQFGVKAFNAFGISNLYIQTELNATRPFIYSHATVSQAYENYNQPLAHPLVSNFVESISIVRYRHKRMYATGQLMFVNQGLDTAGVNYGNDIFKVYWNHTQEYDNRIGQGVNTKTTFANLNVGYIINPKTGLVVELGYTYRNFQPEVEKDALKANTTSMITFSVKHLLFNYYHDL